MSNPGVIKLADEIYGNYRIWLDDNIGEAIHLHINKFRIDMTVQEFDKLNKSIKCIIHKMLSIKNFELDKYDYGFINNQIVPLMHSKLAVNTKINLGRLRVFDDNGICYLPECNRVRALNGEINIDNTFVRTTNLYGQKNSDRLNAALEFIRKNGYPYQERYIVIIQSQNMIIDGWHKAACLYYLYGDIQVQVKALLLEEKYADRSILPVGKLQENSRVILYGAGNNGRIFFRQICSRFKLVAWCDKAYMEMPIVENIQIISPIKAIQFQFDYIIISVLDFKLQEEIIHWLIQQKISTDKIILP